MFKRRKYSLGWLGTGLLILCAGCQTWFPYTAQTLPSGSYLRHPPQYIPPSPPFPLPRELASIEAAAAAQAAGAAPLQPFPPVQPLPPQPFPPVPPIPGP